MRVFCYASCKRRNCVVDSGAVIECRPLVPKVPGSNPVISGFYLWDFSTQTARVLAMSQGNRTCDILNIPLTRTNSLNLSVF